MGRLVSLGLMLLVGVLVYNYFLGDEAEKQQSKEVFQKTRELGKSIKELYQAEKQSHYDEGKYNRILDPIKKVIKNDEELNEKYRPQVDEIDELQEKISDEQSLKERNSPRYDEEKEKLLKQLLDQKLKELTENLES